MQLLAEVSYYELFYFLGALAFLIAAGLAVFQKESISKTEKVRFFIGVLLVISTLVLMYKRILH